MAKQKNASKGKITMDMNLRINCDLIIEKHAKKHPELKPLTQADIAEKIDSSTQFLSDIKSTATKKGAPKIVNKLMILAEMGGCSIEDLIEFDDKL